MSNSDSELRELLSLHLSDVPPITDSNREFLTKRLSRLEEEDGVAKIRWDQEEEEAPKPVSSKRRR